MVTWSEDVNLDRICAGINKHITKFEMRDYHIYGLQQDDRPHIRISPSCPEVLVDLFKRSGYVLEVRDSNDRHCKECDDTHVLGNCHCESSCEYCRPDVISIGLRRDVRRDTAGCRKLIKTILFAMEGKLILEDDATLNLGRRVAKVVPVPEPAPEPLAEIEFAGEKGPHPPRPRRGVLQTLEEFFSPGGRERLEEKL